MAMSEKREIERGIWSRQDFLDRFEIALADAVREGGVIAQGDTGRLAERKPPPRRIGHAGAVVEGP